MLRQPRKAKGAAATYSPLASAACSPVVPKEFSQPMVVIWTLPLKQEHSYKSCSVFNTCQVPQKSQKSHFEGGVC